MDNFFFATQEPSENVEQWGYRLERLATKVLAYGQSISFDEYLDQWATGTRDTFFVAKLEEAIQADDPSKPPVVFDYLSFKTWYSRYINKLVDRRKQLARRSRLMTMSKLRTSTLKVNSKGSKGGQKTPSPANGKTPTRQPGKIPTPGADKTRLSGDLQRRGPAPSVTQNRHSNLFRPSADSLKNKRCYNCDQLGHLAKDCPKPRRPRRQRPQWKDRVQSLVSELYSAKPSEEEGDRGALLQHWQDTVGAFLSSVQIEDKEFSTAPSASSDTSGSAADGHAHESSHEGADATKEPASAVHDAPLEGANANLFEADKAYQAYHIGGYICRLLCTRPPRRLSNHTVSRRFFHYVGALGAPLASANHGLGGSLLSCNFANLAQNLQGGGAISV